MEEHRKSTNEIEVFNPRQLTRTDIAKLVFWLIGGAVTGLVIGMTVLFVANGLRF